MKARAQQCEIRLSEQKVFLVIMVWMMVSKRRFWVTIILVNLDRSGDDKSCDFIIVSAPAVLINLNKNSLKWCELISASHFLYLIFSQILKLTLQQTRIWWRKMGKLENKQEIMWGHIIWRTMYFAAELQTFKWLFVKNISFLIESVAAVAVHVTKVVKIKLKVTIALDI